MPNSTLHLAKLANQQLLVSADKVDWMEQSLRELSSASKALELRLEAAPPVISASADDNNDGYWPDADSWLSSYRPYNVVNGTLIIPVKGMLTHAMSYSFGSYATGYPYIRRAYARGLADGSVVRIAFDVNSSGGEVAGNFDLVDWLFGQKGAKPTAAFVNEQAYSAAYSIASVADKIFMSRTAGVGSIGVVTVWTGVSKLVEKMGYDVQFIHAGAHKVDGNPYEDLPKTVRARIQARIDSLYDIFTATVARNLGLEERVIRDTEALTYGSDDAVRIGLAHEVRAFDDAMDAFASAPDTNENVGEFILKTYTEEEMQAQASASRAEGHAAGVVEGKASGVVEGATAERARVSGILASEDAKTRPALASHLALNTAMSVESANATLSAVPAEHVASASNAPANAFAEAMATNNPNLGSSGGEQDQNTQQEQANGLVADYRAAAGLEKK